MDEIKRVLQQYNIDSTELSDYKSHSHDPDMWSHTFKVKNKNYVLVEVEAVDDDLADDEYARLEGDLYIKRANLKLITPKLEQMHTMNNRDGIGIDGHSEVINADDAKELHDAQQEAEAKRYFPPVSSEELPNQKLKKYKNPYGLQSETTWVLFEVQG